MNDNDKPSNVSDDTVIDHPQLKRDRALALFLARNRARNRGEPLPDPATIGPAVFIQVKPTLSREEIKRNLLAAFKRNGITVQPDNETPNEEKSHDK